MVYTHMQSPTHAHAHARTQSLTVEGKCSQPRQPRHVKEWTRGLCGESGQKRRVLHRTTRSHAHAPPPPPAASPSPF
eukprot:6209445-Pleurochrysis_carterae.AAC.4